LQKQEQDAANGTSGQIVLQRPGEPPTVLSQQDVVGIMQQQQQLIQQLQEELQRKNNGNSTFSPPTPPPPPQQSQSSNTLQVPPQVAQRLNELENMVTMLQKQLIEKTKETKALNRQINDLKNGVVKDKPQENVPQEVFTKIPIEIVEDKRATPKSKSEPEIYVDIGE
jgi:hypothetical protein